MRGFGLALLGSRLLRIYTVKTPATKETLEIKGAFDWLKDLSLNPIVLKVKKIEKLGLASWIFPRCTNITIVTFTLNISFNKPELIV